MKKVLICALISIVTLSGCFPSGAPVVDEDNKYVSSNLSQSNVNEASDTAGVNQNNIPDRIKAELAENLTVNANIRVGITDNFSKYSVSWKLFDENKVENVLLKDKTIERIDEAPTNPYPEYPCKTVICGDGSMLRYDPYGIYFKDVYYTEKDYDGEIYSTEYFVRSDIKEIYSQESIEGLDKEESVQKVQEAVEMLGLQVFENPEVIALDYETLCSQWKDYEDKHGNLVTNNWGEDDGAYVVVYKAKHDGAAVTQSGYMLRDSSVTARGSRIMGVVNKKGLIFFSAQYIYDTDNVIATGIAPISVDKMLDVVKYKYRNTLLTDPVNISDIELAYVPQIDYSGQTEQYLLVPAWVLKTGQTVTLGQDGEKIFRTIYFPIIILAETGQEVLTGGNA